MPAELHPYTKKLKEEILRCNIHVRGRNGIADQANMSAGRVEEIISGSRPTEEEHRKIARTIERMKFYTPIHAEWIKQPGPARSAPPDPRLGQSPPQQVPLPGSRASLGATPAQEPLSTLAAASTAPTRLTLTPRTFGEYLGAAREHEGWTLKDLADLIGRVTVSAVRSWESDDSVPVAENYHSLLEALPVLAGAEVPKPNAREIHAPRGRAVVTAAPPPIAVRSPMIAFGMSLQRAASKLRGERSVVVSLLRDGAAAGMSCEDVAAAIEDAETDTVRRTSGKSS